MTLPGLDVEDLGGGHLRLVAARAFARDAAIAAFAITDRGAVRHRHTLQVDDDAHGLLEPAALRLVDHACDPNAAIDLAAGRLVALRDVAPGEPITAFYPATEWAMAERFTCRCGSARCLGEVSGARDLADAALAGRPVSPHVARALALRRARRDPG